jgi:hypothetical protein
MNGRAARAARAAAEREEREDYAAAMARAVGNSELEAANAARAVRLDTLRAGTRFSWLGEEFESTADGEVIHGQRRCFAVDHEGTRRSLAADEEVVPC